jgi:hypothetical protein
MGRFYAYLLRMILLLALIWLAGWWYLQGQLVTGFRNIEAQYRAQGWVVTHGDISRGTSPLAARINVAGLTLTLPATAGGAVVSMPEFALHIDAIDPQTMHIDLPPKIGVKLASGPAFSLNFQTIDVTNRFTPAAFFGKTAHPVRSGTLSATGVSLVGQDEGFILFSIGKISSAFTSDPDATSAGTAFSSSQSYDDFALSPVLTQIIGLPFQGAVKHLATSMSLSGPIPAGFYQLGDQLHGLAAAGGGPDPNASERILAPVIQAWAVAGGHGALSLDAEIGPMTVHGQTNFSFDAAQQPQGTGHVTAAGFGAFLAAVADAYPAAGDIMTNVDTKLAPYMVKDPNGNQELLLNLALAKSVLSVNGSAVDTMPQINWQNLGQPAPNMPQTQQ